MEEGLLKKLASTRESLPYFLPEIILITAIFLVLILGLIHSKKNPRSISTFTLLTLLITGYSVLANWPGGTSVRLFNGMLYTDGFGSYLKILFDIGALLTVMMSFRNQRDLRYLSEYFVLILSITLGAHLLVMSTNLVMVFLSLELISLSSYALAGFSFDKPAAEGSLKYFLFGSVASAVMLYGFSILYGLTGSLDFSSAAFVDQLVFHKDSALLFMAGLMALAGFFYKIAAAPMHPWAPDVYQSAPMPVVAFFSVVPKLAGIGIFTRFLQTLTIPDSPVYDWQQLVSILAMLTLTIGNFSALTQKNPKRMMAYSSIAQSGFLLVGVVALSEQGIQFMLFYGTVYLIMNFLVFICLQYFESLGINSIADFSGTGKNFILPSVFILTGLVALTGLPPTAGFTGKLLIFTSLWGSYGLSGKPVLLWLFIFGLLNTVISLFYYLRIPYYAFLKPARQSYPTNNRVFENLFAAILVILLLLLFFWPGLLMGWINRINFVL